MVPGTERVREAVRADAAALVLVAADASDNSRDKLMPLLEARGTPHAVAFTRAQLGEAVGRSPLGAVAVTDTGLAGRIADAVSDDVTQPDARADAGAQRRHSR